ncbi:MAG TPA: Hpt domain-containing protein [Blastocatellia bacterium]|nr:Hpt domain-containing protein [Blastocatellia bacterium]
MANAIDVDTMRLRTDQDPQLLGNIIRLFNEEYPPLIVTMKEAIARGDRETIQKAAHKVKGSLVIFGARAAIDAAEAVESLALSASMSAASESVSVLESKIEEVVSALSEIAGGELSVHFAHSGSLRNRP